VGAVFQFWGEKLSFLRKVEKIAEDIKTMRVRGAARIARTAVEGLIITAEESEAKNEEEYLKDLKISSKILVSARPTAVSLPNGIRYVMKRVLKAYRDGAKLEELREETIRVGREFIQNSFKAIEKIGEIGARRIRDGDVILTHCNSSAALSVIITAHRQGKKITVYATETRPRFQGHITVERLVREGIDVRLIVDSAVNYYMDGVDKVIVGADAVASNGAVVNKIGTSLIAASAYLSGVNFFVAAETYKFSPETTAGRLIEIEQRDPTEVVDREFLKKNKGVKVLNPAFDVTPPQHIDLIITERGIIPPQAAIIILTEVFGWFVEEEDMY